MPRYEADAIERTAEKLSPASGVCPQCRREVLVEDGRHQEHTPDQADPGGAELIAAVRAGVAAWKASLVRMASRTSRCCVTCNTETEESPDAVWCESCGALPVICLLPPGDCPLCAVLGPRTTRRRPPMPDPMKPPMYGNCRRCNIHGPLSHHQAPDGGAWLCDACRSDVELECTVEAVIAALEPLGFEGVVVCSDGSEPCASLDLGGASLDVTLQVAPDA